MLRLKLKLRGRWKKKLCLLNSEAANTKMYHHLNKRQGSETDGMLLILLYLGLKWVSYGLFWREHQSVEYTLFTLY